jgi:pimeloyl-ACP methyl ester carboxylesterase
MNTYADVAELVEKLNLRDAIHIGHSTGGGEVARYVAKHGKGRVAKAVLISAVPPIMVKSDKNPGRTPIEVFDKIREDTAKNRAPVLPGHHASVLRLQIVENAHGKSPGKYCCPSLFSDPRSRLCTRSRRIVFLTETAVPVKKGCWSAGS